MPKQPNGPVKRPGPVLRGFPVPPAGHWQRVEAGDLELGMISPWAVGQRLWKGEEEAALS